MVLRTSTRKSGCVVGSVVAGRVDGRVAADVSTSCFGGGGGTSPRGSTAGSAPAMTHARGAAKRHQQKARQAKWLRFVRRRDWFPRRLLVGTMPAILCRPR